MCACVVQVCVCGASMCVHVFVCLFVCVCMCVTVWTACNLPHMMMSELHSSIRSLYRQQRSHIDEVFTLGPLL